MKGHMDRNNGTLTKCGTLRPFDARVRSCRGTAWFFAIMVAVAGDASACTVCFGAKGDPLNEYLGAAILFLLTIITGVIGSTVVFFVTAARRAQKLNLAEAAMFAKDSVEMESRIAQIVNGKASKEFHYAE